MASQTQGQLDLRSLETEKIVTGFALQQYNIRDLLCTISPTSSDENRYFTESSTELTGGTQESIEGVPRGAEFPYMEPNWTRKTSLVLKFAATAKIFHEDIVRDDVDTQARTLLRLARAIKKQVETNVWNVITENQSAVDINSVVIAAGSEWNSATLTNRDPIDNILNAIQVISEQNYDALNGSGHLLLNPKDYRNLLSNPSVRNAGQFYTSDPTRLGTVGMLCGLKVVVSNTVTADYAAVVVAKEACTWKQAEALRTVVIDDPGIGVKIRAWEQGVAQLRNPKAVCLISNTAA